MSYLRRHVNSFAQRWVRVNRLADVNGVRSHLDGNCNRTDHVARVGADHATAEDLPVTVRFR